MSLPLLLDWNVPKEIEIYQGYTYARPFDASRKKENKIIRSHLLRADLSDYSEYKISDYPALFLSFAHAEQTPTGVLSFATKYGLLGKGSDGYFETEEDAKNYKNRIGSSYRGRRDGDTQAVETVSSWIWSIRRFLSVVDLWENLEEASKNHVHWEGYDKVFYTYPENEPTLIASSTSDADILESLRPGDHVGPGRAYLMQIINKYIRDTKIKMTIIDGKMQPSINPHILLDAMWYQLADAIAEDRKYRACEHCGTYFELGVGKAPLTKKYCSDKCRVAANRKK